MLKHCNNSVATLAESNEYTFIVENNEKQSLQLCSSEEEEEVGHNTRVNMHKNHLHRAALVDFVALFAG